MNSFRQIMTLLLIILIVVSSACESEFYLSEAEAATYANLFVDENAANNFTMTDLPGQTLNLRFNNSTSPPTLTGTNLLTLMRNQTTLGVIEGVNRQIRLERLNGELEKQIELFVRKKLDFYQGNNNANVKLSHLNFINVTFLNRPTFTYHPERQTIAFNANIGMAINGTVQVNALDPFLNFFLRYNGNYPLLIQFNDLNLNGEVKLNSSFADASQITLKITPRVGRIGISDVGSSNAPNQVKNGVVEFLRLQFSQPLSATFTQRYAYFSVNGLSLVKDTSQNRAVLRHTYQTLPETTKPLMHIVARSADGKLYHQQKIEGGQNIISSVLPFPSLQERIENEPSLYASAPDQLELAATTVNGRLVFAHWRDEKWGLQTTIAPPSGAQAFRGKPAIIASAPGQVEIVVTGQNGGLWHIRRFNGVWLAPTAVPIISLPNQRTAPYRNPVVALSGNKVVVAFIDRQNRLNASAFDLESNLWGQASAIQTSSLLNSNFAPAIAASGDGQIELVYVGANGTPFHRILRIDAGRFRPNVGTTGISSPGNEVTIGGTLNATPVLVCSSLRQLGLIGRGTDNRLYHNHFVGTNSPVGFVEGRTISQGWQGWADFPDNFSGTLTFTNMSSFTASATGTGKIGVVSLTQPTRLDNNPEQYLHYNTYDSSRYGTQPWKTVQWRGTERIQTNRFIGQPALVMIDRNLSLSYVNNSSSFQRSRLTTGNFIQPTSNNPNTVGVVDVAATSSIPNYTDYVVIETARQIRHYRCKERGSCTVRALPLTQLRTYRSLAVVGYGNGYLEVVATTREGNSYHWRYQNGVWSTATEIAPGIAFAEPVALVNLGIGRLGLILVKRADYIPLVSYFSNGVWSVPRSVTNFPIEPSFFGAKSVKSWGDGAFDYAFVHFRNRDLWQGRIGPKEYTGSLTLSNATPGRAAVNLGGIINDIPVLTAFSPTRMNIIAKGTDNKLYSNWSKADNSRIIQSTQTAPPILWSGYGGMDSNSLKISDVAKSGANEMTVVGADSNGRLLVSRYNGVNWQQFQPIITPLATSPLNIQSPFLTNY